jgi:hypothetical protein
MNTKEKLLGLEISLIQEKLNTNFWQSECFKAKLETVKTNRSIFEKELEIKNEELRQYEDTVITETVGEADE